MKRWLAASAFCLSLAGGLAADDDALPEPHDVHTRETVPPPQQEVSPVPLRERDTTAPPADKYAPVVTTDDVEATEGERSTLERDADMELNDAEGRLRRLESRLSLADREAREEATSLLSTAREKQADARAKLQEMKDAVEERWEDRRSAFEASLAELKESLRRLEDRLP